MDAVARHEADWSRQVGALPRFAIVSVLLYSNKFLSNPVKTLIEVISFHCGSALDGAFPKTVYPRSRPLTEGTC